MASAADTKVKADNWMKKDELVAVVLGGGAGTRLFPLTLHRSKPAVPLAGKYRLIDVPISNCINSEVTRIFVLTQFNSTSLNRHIARSYRFDRFSSGFVTILAAEQTPFSDDWFQGTADAVRQSMVHVASARHEFVLILSGDQLYSMDYQELLKFHKAKKADITIAAIPVTAEEAPGFGILKTNDFDRITEFYEKPAADSLDGKESRVDEDMSSVGRVFLASMGIYIFNKGVLSSLLDANKEAHDFGKQIIPEAIDNLKVYSYPFKNYWSDIGTIRSFYEANLMLTKPTPPFDVYNPTQALYTNARMLPPAKIEDSHIDTSIIAESSVIISSEIIGSVIGLRSFIGKNVFVKDSIMMGADYYPWHDIEMRSTVDGPENPGVAEGSHIENTIIDRNVSIGKNCRIVNADGIQESNQENFYIREGLVVIPKNVVIPEGTQI